MVPEIGSLTDRIFYHLTIFCPLNPLTISIITAQKIKIKKKTKKCLEIYQKLYQKLWSYAILFLRYGAWQMQFLFFILGYFLLFSPPPLPPLTAQKIKIYKKIRKCLEIPSFYIVCNRLTDQQMKKVKYRGGCPTLKSVLKS